MRIYILILACNTFLILNCKSKEVIIRNQFGDNDSIFGTYFFIGDSVNNPSPSFFESIELKKDSTFIYKSRRGGFIRTQLEGKWKLVDSTLTLNSYAPEQETIESIECPNENFEKYLFDIKDNKGYIFNYNLKIDNQWYEELYGLSILDSLSSPSSIQIISSSGIYSSEMKIDPSLHCYKVRIANKRQFINEKWKWYGNKLVPRGLNQEPANYFLYKEGN